MAKEFIEDECTMIVREKKREVRRGLPGRAAKQRCVKEEVGVNTVNKRPMTI